MKVKVIDVIKEFYSIKESSNSLESKPNQYRIVLEKILKYIMGIDLGEFHSLNVLVDHLREYPMTYSLKLNSKTRKLALYFNKWSHSNDSYFNVSEFEEHQQELENLMDLVFETNCKEIRFQTSLDLREAATKKLNITRTKNNTMNNQYRTRFYINEDMFKYFKKHPEEDFILNVIPNGGKHPKGVYNVPNGVIMTFFDEKMDTYNWEKNKTFHQDGVPKALKQYFTFHSI
jgi:hypothetical protein